MKLNELKPNTYQKLKALLPATAGAYLFNSDYGIISDEISLLVANLFLCDNQNACGICDNCQRMLLGKHPDLIVFDKKSYLVDTSQEIINKSIPTPIIAKHKVFVIKNLDNMTVIAQNKLLKTLEEHSDSCIFIFSTSKEYKILPTLLSRFHKINLPYSDFLNIKQFDINERLNNDIEYKQSFLLAFSFYQNINKKNDIPVVVNSINFSKTNIVLTLEILILLYKDTIYNNADNNDLITLKHIKSQLTTIDNEKIVDIINIILHSYLQINSNVYSAYVIDNMLLDILKIKEN